MALTMTWHADEFMGHLRGASAAGIAAASQHLHTTSRQAVSVPAKRVVQFKNKVKVGRQKATKSVVVMQAAPKGKPPRRRTGFGSKNILHKHDRQMRRSRVGVFANAKYMIIHELKDHPWLVPTLVRQMDRMGELALAYTRRKMP